MRALVPSQSDTTSEISMVAAAGSKVVVLFLVGLINVWNRINVAVELPGDHELPT